MTKRLKSKHKIDRRLGENIWGRPKSPVNKRSYGPGAHGQKRRGRHSDYGMQLREKQKLKGYYGNITERQFLLTYKEAARRRGDTGSNLIALLEMRLDAVVYRSKFAPTVFSARQIVSHGIIYVNGRRVTIPSCRLKEGDIVTVKEKNREMILILGAIQSGERDVPEYLEVDHSKFTSKILRAPVSLEEVPYPVQMHPGIVVEFYAKN